MAEVKKQITNKTKRNLVSGEEVELEQQVVLDKITPNEDGSISLLNFRAPIVDSTDEDPVPQDIMNLEKKEDGSYRIRVKKEAVTSFKDINTGDSLDTEEEDMILDLDPSTSSVVLKKNGEELIVKIQSTQEDITYNIVVTATSICVNHSGDTWEFVTDFNNNKTIDVNLDQSIIKEFENNDSIFKKPESEADFPNYLSEIPKPQKAPEPEIVEKKHDISTPVETVGTIATYGGIFMAAISLITPIGFILAPIGIALGLAGVIATTIAGDLKWSTFKKAKKKVENYEEMEAEESAFAEFFFERERDLAQEREKCVEKEDLVAQMLADSESPLHMFSEVYDEYGVGFETEIGIDDSRTNHFYTPVGLELRQNMVSDYNTIQKAKTSQERNALIDGFVMTYFHSMPSEEKSKVLQLFEPRNQETFSKFIKQVSTLNEAHDEYNTKRERQVSIIETISDSQISRIVRSKKLTSAQRKQFFENYSDTILSRHIQDGNFSEAKLTRLISSVPKAEQHEISEIFKKSLSKIEIDMDYLQEQAKKENQTVSLIEQLGNYGHALDSLRKSPTSYSSRQELEEKTIKFLLAHDYTLIKQAGLIEKTQALKSPTTTIDKLSSQAVESAKTINQTVDEVVVENITVMNAYKSVLNTLKNEGEIKTIANRFLVGEETGSSIYPTLNNSRLSPEKTILAIAENLGRTNPAIASSLETYKNAVNASKQKFTRNLPSKLSKIEEEIDALGISVTEEEISTVKASLSTKETFSQLSDEDQTKAAKIKLITEKKIQSLKRASRRDETIHQTYDHLVKIDKFLESSLSGEMASVIEASSVRSQIQYEESSITSTATNLVENAVSEVKQSVQGCKNTDMVIESFSDTEASASSAEDSTKKSIREKFQEQLSFGETPAQALKAALERTLKNRVFEDGAKTYEKIANELTIDGQINLEKLDSLVNQLTHSIEKRGEIDPSTISEIETPFAREIYEQELARNEATKPVYKNEIDLIVQKFGKTEEEVLQAFNNNTEIDTVLSTLGISKNNYLQELQKVNISGFSVEARIKAYKAEKASIRIDEFVTIFKSAFEKAMSTGDITDLNLILNSDDDCELLSALNYFERLNIYPEEIKSILTSSASSEEIKVKLQNYNTNHHVFIKLDRENRNYKTDAKQTENLSFIASRDARKFTQARFDHAELEQIVEEFNTKFDTIISLKDKGFSQSFINEVWEAFVNCDEKFFVDHPEINLNSKYFFSSTDVKLFETLQITRELREVLGEKRSKAIEKIRIKVLQGKLNAEMKVRSLGNQVETTSPEKPSKKNQDSNSLFNFRNRLFQSKHIVDKILEEIEPAGSESTETLIDEPESSLVFEDEYSYDL